MQEKNPKRANFLVKKLIQQSEKKQIDIAQALGVSTVTVTRWVKGGRNISKEHFDELCRYLGINPNEQILSDDKVNELTQSESEPTETEWKRRALIAEAKLKHLQEACNAMGQHVQALGSTVQHFGRIISE